jgi:uncharacterized protein YndB with AHSA1/START domain
MEAECVVKASLQDVWEAFSTSEGLATWLAPEALVELKIGGAFELYFNPDAPKGQRGMEGTTVLAFEPLRMISYQGSAPPHFRELRSNPPTGTWLLDDLGDGRVRITFRGVGQDDRRNWIRAFRVEEQQMTGVMKTLERRFRDGPIDWGRGNPRKGDADQG